MKRYFTYVKVRVEVETDDNINPYEVLEKMNYDFTSTTNGGKIVYTEIAEWDELRESK